MKKMLKVVFALLIGCAIIPLYGQIPISICQIIENPEDNMEIYTFGTVESTPKVEQFMLTSEGCTILCDGGRYEIENPSVGDSIAVMGEIDDRGSLQIETWGWLKQSDFPEEGSIVYSVGEALLAPVGTTAELLGYVSSYGSENTEEELIYDNDTYNTWQGATAQQLTFGVRMSPASPCEVLSVKYYLQQERYGEPWFVVSLYEWEDTLPGTEVWTQPGLGVALTPGWKEQGLDDTITFDGDFVVGYSSAAPIGSLAVDVNLQTGRNWIYNPASREWTQQTDSTYLIRAVVRYTETNEVQELTGVSVKSVNSTSNESLGTFTDNTGSMDIDFTEGDQPELYQDVDIRGVVERGAEGFNVIDVSQWLPQDGSPDPDPFPPDTVTTAAAALEAAEGTVARLFGKISEFTEEPIGIGYFEDTSGIITMDFPNTDQPGIDQNINVLGVVELGIDYVSTDLVNVVDVKYWYAEEEEEPPYPDTIPNMNSVAWTVEDVKSLPVGSLCLLEVIVASWSDEAEREGYIKDDTGSVAIYFDSIVATLPKLNDPIYVLGLSGYNNSELEVRAYHHWMREQGSTGLKDLFKVNEEILVYPNPASTVLNLDQNLVFSRAVLYNMEGKIVKNIPYESNLSIDVSELSRGIYLLSVYDANEPFGSQLIILE